MSTGPERVADAVIDLVDRVGIEGAAAKLSQLAREMEAREARELARRWAWWRGGGPDSLPKPRSTEQLAANVQRMTEMCVTTEDRERLFAWVRETIRSKWEGAYRADPRTHLTEIIGLAADLDSPDLSHAEYLDLAWALIEAAGGWPS